MGGAQAVLPGAWPVTTPEGHADLTAMLLALLATFASEDELAVAARIGAEHP